MLFITKFSTPVGLFSSTTQVDVISQDTRKPESQPPQMSKWLYRALCRCTWPGRPWSVNVRVRGEAELTATCEEPYLDTLLGHAATSDTSGSCTAPERCLRGRLGNVLW